MFGAARSAASGRDPLRSGNDQRDRSGLRCTLRRSSRRRHTLRARSGSRRGSDRRPGTRGGPRSWPDRACTAGEAERRSRRRRSPRRGSPLAGSRSRNSRRLGGRGGDLYEVQGTGASARSTRTGLSRLQCGSPLRVSFALRFGSLPPRSIASRSAVRAALPRSQRPRGLRRWRRTGGRSASSTIQSGRRSGAEGYPRSR